MILAAVSIAVVSVVASLLVALASIASTVYLDRARRHHERHLSLQDARIEACTEFTELASTVARNAVTFALAQDQHIDDSVRELWEHQSAMAKAHRRVRLLMPADVRDRADKLHDLAGRLVNAFSPVGGQTDIPLPLQLEELFLEALVLFEDLVAWSLQGD